MCDRRAFALAAATFHAWGTHVERRRARRSRAAAAAAHVRRVQARRVMDAWVAFTRERLIVAIVDAHYARGLLARVLAALRVGVARRHEALVRLRADVCLAGTRCVLACTCVCHVRRPAGAGAAQRCGCAMCQARDSPGRPGVAPIRVRFSRCE